MLPISKYHGCGNDFLLIRDQALSAADKRSLAYTLCDRHTGIGADGMIFVYTNPLTMEIYNCDGSTAPMCGNGIRCFAKYVYDNHLMKQSDYEVATPIGKIKLHVCSFQPFLVAVQMGKPTLDPKAIQVNADHMIWDYPLIVDQQTLRIDAMFMTTVHTVVFIEDDASFPFAKLGKAIHEHTLFQAKTNVNFVKILDRSHIRVHTYERGVGLTLACGSGCCASVWSAWKHRFVDRDVQVQLEKGTLSIHIDDQEQVIMCGGAEAIMNGYAKLKLMKQS